MSTVTSSLDRKQSHVGPQRVKFTAQAPSQVRAEAREHRDIVLLPNVLEGYFNITHQTLEVLRSAALDEQVTHVLKTDDDSYVRVGMLLQRLRTVPAEKAFLGYIENPGGGPHRQPENQW